MLIIAVCDDNEADRENIRTTIEVYLQQHKLEGQVFAYDRAEKLISAIEEQHFCFDVIFLDIVMGDMDGMACARIIRKSDNFVKIIFLTNSTDYVYEGYEVNAARYLIKPVNETKIADFFQEMRPDFELAVKENIVIASGGAMKRIMVNRILYLESKKNTVKIILAGEAESITLYMTLDAFAQQYPSEMWIRPHKSFLVNFLYIEQYSAEQFVLKNGISIPVSRSYKSKARERFYCLLQNL